MSKREWGLLSEFFDIKVSGGKVQGGAMDNILIAWPPIIKLIKKHFKNNKGKRALDFGCGVGEFCYKLNSMGFTTTGIDSSPKMISKAKKYLPHDIKLIVGDSSAVNEREKYDLITSIQTFQFIKNIKKAITTLDRALKPNGLFILATFNPQFATNCIKEDVLLIDFDSKTHPKRGFFVLGEKIRIPVFIRTAEEYSEMFKTLGYEKVFEEYPPFTKEFLNKYPLKVPPDKVAPSKDPEFMILGYVKP